MRLLAILVVLLAVSSARADDKATAVAAYERAKELVKEKKYAEACPLFEASYKADPQLGVLFNLADCHENIGRFATAWGEFKDAFEIARKKNDPRATRAQERAAALEPRLSKLRITAPAPAIAGLTVVRDGADITILVGAEVAIDPGDHEIVASAPGFLPWKSRVAITGPGTTTIPIPALEKEPVKPVVVEPVIPVTPKVTEGSLTVITQPGAEVFLDSKLVGVGRFTGKVKGGGHTLRITAPGMRSYQSEVNVAAGEDRSIEIALDKELAPTVISAPVMPIDSGPSFELGASMATGVKLRNDRPLVVALRAELAVRIGRRVNLGLFADYGQIDTSNACGYDIAGPMPATPFDFGPRNQFTKCTYLMPGFQIYVHILPASRIDPYIGIGPGFQFKFVDRTTYIAGVPQDPQSDMLPAIVIGGRAGVNYHPTDAFRGWQIGAFIETAITAIGDEGDDDSGDDNGRRFVSFFAGLRSTVAF